MHRRKQLETRKPLPFHNSVALPERWLRWAAALVGLLFLAACSAAATNCSQATFLVTTTDDINDGSCDAAHCSLREAVIAANTCTMHPSYTIEVPAGTYELSLRGPGDDRGDLDLTRNVVIQGVSGTLPMITGDSGWNDRIFYVHPAVEATLQDIWVSGGNSSQNGGGILNEGNLDLQSVTITDNTSATQGGGLYSSGVANLDTVSIGRNFAYLYSTTALTGCGGGIFNSGTMAITASSIHDNDAYNGAGICNSTYDHGSLTIRDSFVRGNGGSASGVGGLGGGISSTSAQLTVENTVIGNNQANYGGGVYATFGEITINDSLVENNLASFGGGIFIGNSPPRVVIRGTEISHNYAERRLGRSGWSGGLGGGVFIATDHFDFYQSPILHNGADGQGGGLYIEAPGLTQGYFTHAPIAYNRNTYGPGGGITIVSGQLGMANVTISNNEGLGNGSAFYNGSDADSGFVHVTVADNIVTDGADNMRPIFNEDGGVITFKNSLIVGVEGDTGCWGDTGGMSSEGGNVGTFFGLCHGNRRTDDRELLHVSPSTIYLPLTDIDGTLLHPLLVDSPAAEWINPPACNHDDQRLAARPQGSKCEAGAYEMDAEGLSFTEESIEIATAAPTPSGIVTIITTTDTGCFKGPGEAWTRYSSLKAGLQAQVVGKGYGVDWLVVQHPEFSNINCWVNLKDVDFDFPLDQLRLISIPGKPTATPGPTNEPREETPKPTVCFYNQQQQYICQ